MGSNALETHNYYGTRASLKPIVPDLEPDWWQDDERRVYIMELFNQIICQSDSANNLAACALVTHAYLQTGDQKYKQWVSPVHNDLAQPSLRGVFAQPTTPLCCRCWSTAMPGSSASRPMTGSSLTMLGRRVSSASDVAGNGGGASVSACPAAPPPFPCCVGS